MLELSQGLRSANFAHRLRGINDIRGEQREERLAQNISEALSIIYKYSCLREGNHANFKYLPPK